MTTTMPSTIKFGTEGWRAVISDQFTFANVRLVAQAIAEHYAAQDPQARLARPPRPPAPAAAPPPAGGGGGGGRGRGPPSPLRGAGGGGGGEGGGGWVGPDG